MTTTIPMLTRTLEAAEDIQGGLIERTEAFDQAIERRKTAYSALQEAKQTYADAESELTFDIMFSDEEYGKAKNAETRKAVLDYRFVKARQPGQPLAAAWGALNRAQSAYDDADAAFQQAEAQFRAIRAAADLHARYLNAVAAS